MRFPLLTVVFSIAIASTVGDLRAAPEKKISRANDLSGVLADMDDGNRENKKSIPITAGMKDDGIELIIHRLTIGRRLFKTVDGQQKDDADASYTERAQQAFAANILFGAYHVLYASPTGEDNGVEQARGFLSAVKDRCVAGQRIILAVDWESTSCKGKKSCGTPEPKYLKSFIPAVSRVTGKPVLVYTSPSVLSTYSSEIAPGSPIGELLRANPLWLASYYRDFRFARGDNDATVRSGFVFPLLEQHLPWDQWKFWQYAASEINTPAPSKSVSLTIQDHRLDLSWFAGGREEFRDFYAKHSVKCDSIDPSKL